MKNYACVSMPEDMFADAVDSNQGWCPDCAEFTIDFAEPDAEGYKCEECGNRNAVGAENALIMGLISFEEV